VAIAENLKHHRKENEMSQVELAKQSGVSQAQISAIENGNKPNPGVVTIKKLADALSVGVEELIK
jgi:transcriptional regulator with XRE-family HTH domain